MRAIKYKAWNGEKMLTPYEINFNKYGISVRCKEIVETVKNPILLQYTGLKDKKAKEIYEGDLVRHNDETYEVKYGCQEVDAFEGIGFNLWGFIGEYNKLDCSRLSREIEVIGNIYENPDLLKGTI